jgi:hypothetical protein
MQKVFVAAGVAGMLLSATYWPAFALPVPPVSKSVIAGPSFVVDARWRNCWRDRWGRLRCNWCWRDRWGRVRCG